MGIEPHVHVVGAHSFSSCHCLGGCSVAGRCHGLGSTAARGTGAVRGRSLLCCLGRPRAAKPAFMARSGVGIIRFLPHSLGEWTLCPGRPMSDEPRSHLIAPYCMHWMIAMFLTKCLNSLCMFYCLTPSPTNLMALLLDDFFVKSLSYVLAVWPCQFFVCLGPRCRPVLGRHCSEQLTYLLYYQDLMTEL